MGTEIEHRATYDAGSSIPRASFKYIKQYTVQIGRIIFNYLEGGPLNLDNRETPLKFRAHFMPDHSLSISLRSAFARRVPASVDPIYTLPKHHRTKRNEGARALREKKRTTKNEEREKTTASTTSSHPLSVSIQHSTLSPSLLPPLGNISRQLKPLDSQPLLRILFQSKTKRRAASKLSLSLLLSLSPNGVTTLRARRRAHFAEIYGRRPGNDVFIAFARLCAGQRQRQRRFIISRSVQIA